MWFDILSHPSALPHTFSFSQTKTHIQKLSPSKGIRGWKVDCGENLPAMQTTLVRPSHTFSTSSNFHSRGFWKTEVGRTNHPGQPDRKEKNVWFLLRSIKICWCIRSEWLQYPPKAREKLTGLDLWVWVIAVFNTPEWTAECNHFCDACILCGEHSLPQHKLCCETHFLIDSFTDWSPSVSQNSCFTNDWLAQGACQSSPPYRSNFNGCLGSVCQTPTKTKNSELNPSSPTSVFRGVQVWLWTLMEQPFSKGK